MFANILIGLLLIGVGVAIMIGSRSLVEFFGDLQWAVKNLGSTRSLYALIGFGLCVLGALFMFGIIDVATVQETSIQGFGTLSGGAVSQ